jgi:luciferase-type oxidoreductase
MFTPNKAVLPQSNPGYQRVFKRDKLNVSLFFPLESYQGDMPSMADQVALAKYAEQAGFASLVFRDVPLRDPNFGDNAQIFDIWTYLAYIAAQTSEIALMTAGVILPLRHPLHTAKAAASIDQLSNGRLLLGVGSGDRDIEFPAFNIDYETRGIAFREKVELLKIYWGHQFPQVESSFGTLLGADVIPKPKAKSIPLIVIGHSQQDLQWIAQNADGWITYHRNIESQQQVIQRWKSIVSAVSQEQYKPFSQSYVLDLTDKLDQPATPIRLGHALGRKALISYLHEAKAIGVDHIMIILKYGSRPAKEVIEELAEFVLPTL